jgi:pimeloyl-ACP methyl ester carboxylesterase
MTDFLLVHGAGQGAWIWGSVWGHLTAPVEHPPRLHAARQSNRVRTLDLPGHGADAGGDTDQVRMEECVHAIVRMVEREGLKDVVLVGHDFAGSLIMQASYQLNQPPKRLVLVAGIVPAGQRSMLAVLPRRTRTAFRMLNGLSKLSRQEFRLPGAAIRAQLCNGMGPMEVVEVLGFFGALPTKVLTARVVLEDAPLPCPVTYVELTKDRLLPPAVQQRMAQRLAGVEVLQVDSCHQAMLQKPREVAEVLLRYA